jgi:hypothetical protein
MSALSEIKKLLKKYGEKENLTNTNNDWGFGGTTGYKVVAVINGQTFSGYFKKRHYRRGDPSADIGYYVGDVRFVGAADWLDENQFLTLLKAAIDKREHFILRFNNSPKPYTHYLFDGDAEALIAFANVQLKEWKKFNEMDNTPEILSRKEAVDFFTKVVPINHRHYALFQSAP